MPKRAQGAAGAAAPQGRGDQQQANDPEAAAAAAAAAEGEEDEGELEKLTPPPILEAVIYAAAWLDAAAWQVLVDSASLEFVGCADQVNRPKLRGSLTECGIESRDQEGVLEVRKMMHIHAC